MSVCPPITGQLICRSVVTWFLLAQMWLSEVPGQVTVQHISWAHHYNAMEVVAEIGNEVLTCFGLLGGSSHWVGFLA